MSDVTEPEPLPPPPAPHEPTLGEVVHYHYPSRAGIVHLAAIVVRVNDPISGSVNLRTLDDGSDLGAPELVQNALRAGAYGQSACWSPRPATIVLVTG